MKPVSNSQEVQSDVETAGASAAVVETVRKSYGAPVLKALGAFSTRTLAGGSASTDSNQTKGPIQP